MSTKQTPKNGAANQAVAKKKTTATTTTTSTTTIAGVPKKEESAAKKRFLESVRKDVKGTKAPEKKETTKTKPVDDFVLPDDVTIATGTDPKDFVIIGIPKIGKGNILGALSTQVNALVLDLEKDGYEYIDARKLSTYKEDTDNMYISYKRYMTYRNALLKNKGKYKYLIIDGLSDLDALSEIGGTLAYMNSVQGKKFNRKVVQGQVVGTYPYGHSMWQSVNTLPDGAGYLHTRRWFMAQIDIFKQISPYRLYAAHVLDKYIKDGNKEQVIGSEIALTGKLKTIFSSRTTTMCKMTAEGDSRFLNFDIQNDSIIAGSRAPMYSGKRLISTKISETEIKTFWENIYSQHPDAGKETPPVEE